MCSAGFPRLRDFSEISPKWQHLPSVLLEVGYHDTVADARQMEDAAFRQAFADGIRDGLVAWRLAHPVDAPPPVVPAVPGAGDPAAPADIPITLGNPPQDNPGG